MHSKRMRETGSIVSPELTVSQSKIQSCWQFPENHAMLVPDARFVSIDLWDCQRPVGSRVALEAEILVLSQQIQD